MDTLNQSNEAKSKFEGEIRSLAQQVKEMTEQIFELENQLKDEE